MLNTNVVLAPLHSSAKRNLARGLRLSFALSIVLILLTVPALSAVTTVTSVTSNLANGSYTVGQVVDVRVTFSLPVTYLAGTGVAQIQLETGITDRQVAYSSGTGTAELVFNYTVQATDTSPDLEYLSASALTLTGTATIKNGTTNATLTLPALNTANSLGGSKAIMIAFVPNDPYFHRDTPSEGWPGQWHLINEYDSGLDARVQGAWNRGIIGTGVTIGIIDDGFEITHPDLSGNYIAADSWDFIGNDANPSPSLVDPVDIHGTAAAGVAAARGGNGIGVTGAAPNAGFAGLRVNSTMETRRDATLYHSSGSNTNIKIKNHSYAATTPYVLTADEETALATSAAAGTIHVFAAGNERGSIGQDSNKKDLQNSPDAITVAGMGSNGIFSSFSCFGANVFVTAPSSSSGQFGITTTDLTTAAFGYNDSVDSFPNTDYTSAFGTSSCAPLVAGVMALVKQVQPNLNVRFAKHLLVRTSDVVDPTDTTTESGGGWKTNGAGYKFNQNYGFGLVNADALTQAAVLYTGVTALTTVSTGTINVAAPIPDNDPAGVSRTFNIASTTPLEEVLVTLNITHTWRGDLEAVLTSPSGTTSRLMRSYANDSGANINWTFSTNAFWGENPAGTWTLKVLDTSDYDTGTWNSYSATLRMGSLNPAPTVSTVAVQTGLTVDVTFSEAMVTAGVTTAGNYTLSGTGKGTLASNPTSVALVSGNKYRLTWTAGEMVNGGDIKITVANVQSLVGLYTIGWPNSGTHIGGGIGTPPAVSTVTVQTGLTVDVTFTEAMAAAGGVLTAGNYTVSGAGKGTLADNPDSVVLKTGNTYTLTWLAPSEMKIAGVITITVANVQDLAGNPIGATNSKNGVGSGIAPTVVLSDDHPDNIVCDANTVIITATFTEANGINETTPPKISINNGGVTSVVMTKTSNLIWTYTWNVPTTTPTPATVSISATDLAGNLNTPATGKTSYIVDNVKPTVVLTDDHPDAFVRDADTVIITATFTEANGINETTPPTITITNGGVTAAAMNRSTNLVWTYTWDVPAGSAAATVSISATDMEGNPNSPATGQTTYTIDNTAPTVLSVTSNLANGSYKVGQVVDVRVTFSEAVTYVAGTGVAQIQLETGATDRQVAYSSGSGAAVLIFNYTVQAGDASLDLEYLSTSALTLTGTASIKDTAGNNATLTLPTLYTPASLGGSKAIVIDGIAPTVLSVTSNLANGSYKAGQVVDVRVTFSENVTYAAGTGVAQIQLETGDTDRQVAYTSGSGTAVLLFNYTVQAGDASLDLEYLSTSALTLTGTATIRDAVLNNATLTLPTLYTANSLGGSKAIVIDTTAPTVLSIVRKTPLGQYYNGASVVWTVTFNETINATTVSNADFTLVDVSATITGESITSVTPTTGTAAAFDVTVNTGTSGNGTLRLDVMGTATINDVAGNDITANYTSGETYIIDKTAPTVSTVLVQTGLTVDVTFSEAMGTGVTTAGNYTVSGTGKGTLANNPNSVALVSGNKYRLTWTAGEMVDGGDITITVASAQDLAGNTIGSPNSGTHTGGGIGSTSTPVANLAALKLKAGTGETVKLTGTVTVTCKNSGLFFVGEQSYKGCIKVVGTAVVTAGAYITDLIGIVTVDGYGQYTITIGSNPVTTTTGGSVIKAVGANNKTAKTDAKLRTNLVKVWGLVAGATIDDGYGAPITVINPALGAGVVAVSGILWREGGDVVLYQNLP
ncbi:MAG: S8 family serine peptidase [Armatimonadetes bacterium]|nr:S8 family serine peptidase [Armatimonadota bacterium]